MQEARAATRGGGDDAESSLEEEKIQDDLGRDDGSNESSIAETEREEDARFERTPSNGHEDEEDKHDEEEGEEDNDGGEGVDNDKDSGDDEEDTSYNAEEDKEDKYALAENGPWRQY